MKIVFFQNNAGEAVVLNGLAFGEPDIELIDKKERIWEIKNRFGGNIYRIFFTINEDAILLHGFQKKTQKTPTNEINTAVKRLNQYHKDRKER